MVPACSFYIALIERDRKSFAILQSESRAAGVLPSGKADGQVNYQ